MENNDEKILKKTILGFSILLIVIGIFNLRDFIFLLFLKGRFLTKIGIFFQYLSLLISILSFISFYGIIKRKKFGFNLGAIVGILMIGAFLINLILFGEFSLSNLVFGISLFLLSLDKTVQRVIFHKVKDEDKSKSQEMIQNEDAIDKDERMAKAYILRYKMEYSRDSIRQGLLNAGISEDKIEEYLNRYF